MNHWQRFLVFMISVSLLISLSPINGTAADKILKIGGIMPLTGPAARTGAEFKAALQLAFDKIGYKIGDYNVELIWIDDQSDLPRPPVLTLKRLKDMGSRLP